MTAAGAVEALMALVRDGDAQGKANAAGALWTLAAGNATIEGEVAMEAIIDALRVALKSIHEQIKQMGGVDKVEELVDELEDFLTDEHDLQCSIDAELAEAKLFMEGFMRQEALQCLKEKKMYEQQLMTLGTKKMKFEIHIENLKLTVESMKMNAEIIDALRVAWTMQELVKLGCVDNVEELAANDLSNFDLGDRTMTSSSSSSMGSWRRSWWPICLRSTCAARSNVRNGDAQGKANAAAAMRSQGKKKIIREEQVEDLMDEVEDALTDVREIQEAMGRKLSMPWVDADDDELMDVTRAAVFLTSEVARAGYGADEAKAAGFFKTIEEAKVDHLQRKIDAEWGNAMKFNAAGKKREALQCIQTKKMYEQQLAHIGTLKINVADDVGGVDKPRFKLNDRVECRDDGKKWFAGKVVSVEPLLVQPDAWNKGFTWDAVLPRLDDDELFAELDGLLEEEVAAALDGLMDEMHIDEAKRELEELEAAMAG
jgi:hypothetical protein